MKKRAHITMMPRTIIVALALLSTATSFQPTTGRHAVATRVAPLNAGFAANTRKKKTKKGKQTDASGLSTDDGWVPLTDITEPVKIGAAKAVGRTIQGKPYLVRRLASGELCTTSTECGRCEYPLLQSEQIVMEDDSEIVCCEMCGAAFDTEDGSPQPANEGSGKPLVGGLLKAKPQKALLVFPNRELSDGRVFVNITPYKKKLFEDEE